MAIEKVGDDPTAYRQVTCKRCGSILRYLPKDVETKVHTDISGTSDAYSFIKCPDCNATVYVKE